jgi:hypothetical protein
MSLGEDDDRRGTDDPYTTMGGTRQTRTRMPDDAGAGRTRGSRPGARPSRSMITVVGVVVLLVAAIAFANRGPGSGPADKGEGKEGAPSSQSTAATGEKPVNGKTGGIPSGFARTSQGAQSAAANYAVALGSADMYLADRRREIVAAVYTPEVATARQGALDKVYSDPSFLKGIGLNSDSSAPKGLTFISRTNPAGAKIESVDADNAKVSIWYSSIFGLAGEGSTNPVSESWYTNTFSLKWVGNDWKVVDFTQKNGPAPIPKDQTAGSAQEMADAVDQYGGFTYAR